MNGQFGSTAEARAQSATPTPPQLEGFTVLEFLGAGPSGQTWHARTKTGRAVALKLLAPRLSSQPGFLARFEKETAPLMGLRHPHIAELIDRGRTGELFYLATEYVSGGSLQKRAPELPDASAAMRVVLEVSKALHHVHLHGLQHRGLKPENILLTSSGMAKVTDFGLARLREDEAVSPGPYTAPEQRTRAASTDGRVDLYALATVLYELLYRERPPKPWSAAASKVPVRDTKLFSLFSQSLAEEPDRRFKRMLDFADELERLPGTTPWTPASPASTTASPASGPLLLEVKGRTICVKVRARGDAEWLKRSLLALEQVLRQQGPWGIAYDLSEMTGWSTREIEVLVELHRRFEKNLRRVGFCSSLPSVRGGGVLVGTSVKELPWNTFASARAMQDWVDG
ncbi:serine/threonine-protein kinase [Hyalangium versicolor]|uniref:serine/threonine-protein kinase n=1 Tax=Hyalangium versicolor TaxID=2861190 RepID=UPI001CCD2567|nr:serine/threonine-protein kinase [Hyalangium versicolor]